MRRTQFDELSLKAFCQSWNQSASTHEQNILRHFFTDVNSTVLHNTGTLVSEYWTTIYEQSYLQWLEHNFRKTLAIESIKSGIKESLCHTTKYFLIYANKTWKWQNIPQIHFHNDFFGVLWSLTSSSTWADAYEILRNVSEDKVLGWCWQIQPIFLHQTNQE